MFPSHRLSARKHSVEAADKVLAHFQSQDLRRSILLRSDLHQQSGSPLRPDYPRKTKLLESYSSHVPNLMMKDLGYYKEALTS